MADEVTKLEYSSIEQDPDCKELMDFAIERSNTLRSKDYSGIVVHSLVVPVESYTRTSATGEPARFVSISDNVVLSIGLPIHSIADSTILKDSIHPPESGLLDDRLRNLYSTQDPASDVRLFARLVAFIRDNTGIKAAEAYVKGAQRILDRIPEERLRTVQTLLLKADAKLRRE